ncbi:MAG: AarF/ABC1/UbiB kinase family protein [Oscillospiraceae bacterium]|nr:AarF/ABC1/UbiB kinase family protein [Oscillospiraceae bacterium]
MSREPSREEEMNALSQHRGVEIFGVFAKHNFFSGGFTPEELRTTLEDLRPTYVKIGQIMSSRTDILPERYCKELEKLRSNVKPLDAAVARRVIEQETGRRIEDIYSEFRDEPLGSASIAQAHYGVLKDGTRVVTKVQRPYIADMVRKDFVLLKRLAAMVNVAVQADEGGAMVDLKSVIAQLEQVTEEELDFRIEAENTRLFRANCIEDERRISCPSVIDSLTTQRIMTQTFVDGYSIARKDRIDADGVDRMEVGKAIVEN